MAHHHPHLSATQLAKRDTVEEIKKQIEECHSFVIIDYKGLTVAQDTEFRSEFRKQGVVYKVIKNTLFKKALNELGYTQFDEALNGPSAFAFGTEDAIAPAKVAVDGIKKYNAMQVKCCVPYCPHLCADWQWHSTPLRKSTSNLVQSATSVAKKRIRMLNLLTFANNQASQAAN